MDDKLRAIMQELKPYGFNEQTLMLARAMKDMKDTGYGNLITLPADPGETGSAAYKIDLSDFAWTKLFYCLYLKILHSILISRLMWCTTRTGDRSSRRYRHPLCTMATRAHGFGKQIIQRLFLRVQAP